MMVIWKTIKQSTIFQPKISIQRFFFSRPNPSFEQIFIITPFNWSSSDKTYILQTVWKTKSLYYNTLFPLCGVGVFKSYKLLWMVNIYTFIHTKHFWFCIYTHTKMRIYIPSITSIKSPKMPNRTLRFYSASRDE